MKKWFTHQNFLQKNLGGFTLIELLVVIAIIGILAGMVLTVFNSARAHARDAKRVLEITQLQKIMEIYNYDKNGYPLSTAGYEITGASWGGSWPGYTPLVPKDPISTQNYAYISDGKTYQIYAKFEKSVDRTFNCGACGPNNNYNAVFTPSGTTLQNLIGYRDGDGDTYGAGSPTQFGMISSLPPGYVSNNSDCNDGNVDEWRLRYLDSDGDGYCASSSTTCVGNHIGYRDSCTAFSDCNDGNIDEWRFRYPDADGDGYGVGTAVCVGNQAGYADNAGDCCDSDANAYPGEPNYFTVANACGSFDYDCNGGETFTSPYGEGGCLTGISTAPGCYTSLPTTGTQGWVTRPSCGQTGSGIWRQCKAYRNSTACGGSPYDMWGCFNTCRTDYPYQSWAIIDIVFGPPVACK